jgi:hypothetical protein
LVRLEEAEFTDTLGADSARGEVGHAAGGEFDPDVGNINFA